MPNWCRGVLKIRGTKTNLKNFIENGIDYNDYKFQVNMNENGEFEQKWKPIPREVEIVINDEEFRVSNIKRLHIKETRQMFITDDEIDEWIDERKKRHIICVGIGQAWGIQTRELKELSKQYNVDFHIFATVCNIIECGMGFCQEVEIVGGEIIKNKEIKFDDFKWEAPDPRI